MTAGVTLSEMIEVCAAEASRIEKGQEALVACGDRKEPHAGQLRKRDVFNAVVRMIERIKSDRTIVERLKGKAS